MSFRITGLDPALFRHLYGLADDDLAALGVRRLIADSSSGFPDRVEVRDVDQGQSVLLLNHTHQPAATPYRASHAIFVREGAERRFDAVDQIPEALLTRPISLRAFDEAGDMVDADLAAGEALAPLIARFLANSSVGYLHAHFARRGCYAAHIARA